MIVDSQATISSSYMRLQFLWRDSLTEFDQIPRLQNLDQWEEHCKTPQITKPLSVPHSSCMRTQNLWSDNFAEFDEIPH